MKSLIKTAIIIFLGLLVFSIVSAIWESTTFDNEFIGLVQNTTRKSDSMIRDDIINLAFDHEYEIDDTDIYSEVVGDELRFHVSYEVELGIAGLSYIWHKNVSAITTGGAHVGVPQGIEHMPNSPNMRPTYGKSVKNRAKTSADKMNQRLKNR